MVDDFTHDVFLSHSSKDKPIVEKLAQRLRGDGLRVWFDKWEIHLGDSIPAKINEGLECSRVLVLCMSAHAFDSDWAKLESYTYRFRDPLNRDRRFIPLRLDDTPIKGSLAQFLYIDWFPENREEEYAKLLKACRPPETSAMLKSEDGVGEYIAQRVIKPSSGVEPSRVVRLSNWSDNVVESGWKALEQLLNPRQLQFEATISGDISKGKLIDRTMLDNGFTVTLTLKQEKLADDSFDTILRIYPTGEQVYLPSGIKLRMFGNDKDGNKVSADRQASTSDEWIQLHFTGEPGEEFGVEIVKGDISVIENFVI